MAFTSNVVSSVTSEVVSSGTQTILYGGTANCMTVFYGGYQNISSGGVANSTGIGYNGYQNIFSGGVANSTAIEFGSQYVSSGGIANSTTINYGGEQYVSAGGAADYTNINSSGGQTVSSGGVASHTAINSGGWQQVSSGGVASSTTISSGGSQWIFGGTANSTTINSGGDMRFFGSGMATNTTINSGGVMALGIGASATNIYQQSGGAVYFTTGATVINGINTRTDGHSAFSIVDGVASNFLLASGGCLAVQSGRSAANTIIGNGAAMNIGSADYYYLNMTNAGALTLNLTGLSSDANLALYDAKGKLLKASNNKSNANENITSMALSGGAYYVKIAPADGGKGTVNNTGYTLSNTVDYFPADTAGNTFAAALKVTASGRISEWVGWFRRQGRLLQVRTANRHHRDAQPDRHGFQREFVSLRQQKQATGGIRENRQRRREHQQNAGGGALLRQGDAGGNGQYLLQPEFQY